MNKNLLTATLDLNALEERGIDPKAARFLLHLFQCKGVRHGSLPMKKSARHNFTGSFMLFAEEMLDQVRGRKSPYDEPERRERLSLEGTPFPVQVETSCGPVTLRLQRLWFSADPNVDSDEVKIHELKRFVNLHVARQLQLRPVTRGELEALVQKRAENNTLGDPPHYVDGLFLTTGTLGLYGAINHQRESYVGDVRGPHPYRDRWEDSETKQHDSDSYGSSFSADELWVVGK